MAKLVKYNERYEFETESEEKSSWLLSESNLAMIKNQLYFERNRKENLDFDPVNPQLFMQAEAEVRGAIGVYQFLLDKHNELITGISVDPGYPQASLS